jgi:hypothetical protein
VRSSCSCRRCFWSERRTSSANGACGRQDRQESAGMRLARADQLDFGVFTQPRPKGDMRQLRQEQLGLVKLWIDARLVLTNAHRGGDALDDFLADFTNLLPVRQCFCNNF